MRAINELLQHSDERVRELGQKAVRYKAQLDQQEIEPAEYASLRAQLVNLEALNEAADSADQRQALAEAVQFLSTYLPMVL